MTVSAQEQITDESEQLPSSVEVKIEDSRAAHRAGQKAFKELTAPIRGSMTLAQVLGVLYGALAVAPYVILVQLGEVLLAAARLGVSPDRGEVIHLLMWLLGAFGMRYGIYFHPFRGCALWSHRAHAHGESACWGAPRLVHLDEFGGCAQGNPR